jgi:hypothetical protein
MTETLPDTIATRIVNGDLAALDDNARVLWYSEVCRTLGMNPATRPFQFITMPNGRLTLYATKDATDQLRRRDQISTTIVERRDSDDIYSVIARASRPDGRHEESIGAVALGGLKGEAKANALMKAETKAKRRATLSICGLGFLDETEVADTPGVEPGSTPVDPGPDKANNKFNLVTRYAYDELAKETDAWSIFARNLLNDAIDDLTTEQREWLKNWTKDHFGPDGHPWPNINNRRAFTPDHAPILAEWIHMAAQYSPPCEADDAS